jgi:hypothetical protein
MPSKSPYLRLLLKALVISLFLNLGIILAGLSAGVEGGTNFLTKLSDMVAAPPGLIISRCCSPKEHTAHAFDTSMFASIAISVLFYALICWAILALIDRYKQPS